jgi:hypothetical protein
VVIAGFVLLPLLVAAGFVAACDWAARRLGEDEAVRRRRTTRIALGTTAWLVVTLVLAASGVLRRFDLTPPPFAGLVIAVVVIGVSVSCSSIGTLLIRGLPLSVLVGAHVFRFPLELVMHEAYAEGVMPVQMSYSGRNLDIVTGITAGLLGLWLSRAPVPPLIVHAWNVMGVALLVNVVGVALVSTPVLRWFGDDHLVTFVADPPYVWLPAILVMAALMGHILVWRKLRLRKT